MASPELPPQDLMLPVGIISMARGPRLLEHLLGTSHPRVMKNAGLNRDGCVHRRIGSTPCVGVLPSKVDAEERPFALTCASQTSARADRERPWVARGRAPPTGGVLEEAPVLDPRVEPPRREIESVDTGVVCASNHLQEHA